MKRLWQVVLALTLLALGFALGLVYGLIRPGALVLNQDAIVADVPRDLVTAVVQDDAGRYLDVRPKGIEVKTVFIFYPGGLVRPQAYQWLGMALAPLGVRTLIPVMPYDLAVLAPERAERLLETLELPPEKIVIGGHSLGGAMAARFVRNHPDEVGGLVLMGAYSAEADDLSDLLIPVLVLAAERDGLAELETVRSGLRRLPANARLEVVPGAVHSFFGRYGPQRGDGLPTVTRAEAESAILSALRSYFAER